MELEHTSQREGLGWDNDLTDCCSCLSDQWGCIFFPELQCPGIKETYFSTSISISHRNSLFRSEKEVMQPVLLAALLTYSKLLSPIPRRPLSPQGKWEEGLSPSSFPSEAHPGCLVTASSFSVSRWKGTCRRRSAGNPTVLVSDMRQSRPWERGARASAPPHFLT